MKVTSSVIAAAAITSVLLSACSANAAEESSELPVWILVETLRIGSIEGDDYPLRSAGDLLPGLDGSVLVSQSEVQEVPEFGPDGRLLRVIGRRGSGPGEFRNVSGIGWLGDTLWISDFRNVRISYFSADGTHLEDQRVELEFFDHRRYLYPWPPILLASEWGIMRPGIVVGGPYSRDVELAIFKTDRSGRIVDTLSFWRAEDREVTVERQRGPATVPLPFTPSQQVGVSPGGVNVAVLTPFLEEAGQPATAGAHLAVYGATLDTVLTRELSAPAVAIPPELIEARARRMAERLGSDENERSRIAREIAAASSTRRVFPLADDILIADSGEIWLRMGHPHEGPRTWWILDERGSPRASVVTPDGVALRAIGGDAIWGVYLDELDVPHIVRFELRRS